MNNYKNLILIIILTISVIMLGFTLNESLTLNKKKHTISKNSEENNLRTKTIKKNGCVFQVEEKIIKGNSMEPLFINNKKVWYAKNYYHNCKEKIERGDIVIFNKGDGKDIIKEIYGLPGDIVSKNGENLHINGNVVKNSENKLFVINNSEFLKIKSGLINGKIPKLSYILLGNNVYQSMDSRYYGIILYNDIKGKIFTKISNQTK